MREKGNMPLSSKKFLFFCDIPGIGFINVSITVLHWNYVKIYKSDTIHTHHSSKYITLLQKLKWWLKWKNYYQ